MTSAERERARPASREADEMEALEPGLVGEPTDSLDFGIQAISGRRFVTGVQLEFLVAGVNVGAERADEVRISQCRGQNAPRQKDRLEPPILRREPPLAACSSASAHRRRS